jgi:membrane protein DedA with SNARE-associated domain/rhodanese-related sulfurtransferase
MQYLLDLLTNYGPLVIMTVAFMETLGVPIPAFPFFVLTGCLIAEDSLFWPPIIIAAVIGALMADLVWYYLGKWMGKRALDFLCRLSFNPDACMGRSQHLFHNRSVGLILIAKLIPGVNTLVPSLSGMVGMNPIRYVLIDTAACLIWVSTGVGFGLAFGRSILSHLEGVQYTLFGLLVAMIAFYVIFRVGYRHYLLKYYTIPRIEADALQTELASDNGPIVIDLRNATDYFGSSQILPGARRISPADFDIAARTLPKDKKIVLYCTCPDEATSARMARTLKNTGHSDVAALQGGFDAWVKRGFTTAPKPLGQK